MLPETYAVSCVPLAANGTTRLPACAQRRCATSCLPLLPRTTKWSLTPLVGFARTTRCAGAKSVFATRWVRSTGRTPRVTGVLAEPSAARAVSAPACSALNVPSKLPSAATAPWATVAVPIVRVIASPGTTGATRPANRIVLP